MEAVHFFYLIIGFVLLIGGAEWLVRGASNLAMAMGVSPLVVGLTVVAFGTSAPELGVSMLSCFEGRAGIAVGNVVGSNLCNVLLILGLAALTRPLPVSRRLIRLDVPLVIGASLATWLMARDLTLSRFEGLFLFSVLLIYIGRDIYLIRRKNNSDASDPVVNGVAVTEPAARKKNNSVAKSVGLFTVGLAAITIGSRFLVSGAVAMAVAMGVSELVIGLTIVAIGTSLPEIATSIIAGLRGSSDIAVGNIVGSNLFNLLAVLGLTAVVAPSGVPISPQALAVDFPLMVLVMAICYPLFKTGMSISRLKGAALFGAYLCYMAYLFTSGA